MGFVITILPDAKGLYRLQKDGQTDIDAFIPEGMGQDPDKAIRDFVYGETIFPGSSILPPVPEVRVEPLAQTSYQVNDTIV